MHESFQRFEDVVVKRGRRSRIAPCRKDNATDLA
jgi:hypothetical protein